MIPASVMVKYMRPQELADYRHGWKLGAAGTRYEAVGASFAQFMGWLDAMVQAGRLERCGPFARCGK